MCEDGPSITVETLKEMIKVLAETPIPPRIRFSPHMPKTGDPMGRPITSDMREMVEDLQDRGETKKVPMAFKINDEIVMHESYLREFEQQFASAMHVPRRLL